MGVLGPISALGTSWWLEVHDAGVDTAAIALWFGQRLLQFDADYSRFKADSYVGQLNTKRILANPPPELVTLLTRGQHWYEGTGGQFNILTATSQVAQGYGQLASVPAKNKPVGNPVSDIVISDTEIRLTSGAIDLGGFGKGWLIDRLAEELATQFGSKYFLLNGGGDMYGTCLPDNAAFEIAVEHPETPGMYIAKIPLHQAAFAASSTYKRQWQQAGAEKNHIIEPQKNVSVAACANHVVATDAETADVYATLGCIDHSYLQNTVLAYCLMPASGPAHVSKNFSPWLLG